MLPKRDTIARYIISPKKKLQKVDKPKKKKKTK